jgi:virulence factor
MAVLKIGHVDLDTSHPENWIPIERDLGHDVVGVWDGGSVWPQGYAAQFAAKLGVPKVYDSLEQMADEVDLAIIHSANWDLHVPRARVFVERGKAVLLDKPMVGNLRDYYQVREWAQNGVKVSGGSSLRFAAEVKAFLAEDAEKRGEPRFAFGGCGVDEFNYGIHAYSMLFGLLGPGVENVRYLGSHGQKEIELVWADGKRGVLVIGAPTGGRWLPFHASVVSDRAISQVMADAGRLYRAMLETLLPYYAGDTAAPLGFEELIQPELAALAARQAWQREGERIFLNDLRLDDPGYDGAAFAAGYRLQRLAAAKK